MRHAHLKMGILLHKQATVRFDLILAVWPSAYSIFVAVSQKYGILVGQIVNLYEHLATVYESFVAFLQCLRSWMLLLRVAKIVIFYEH